MIAKLKIISNRLIEIITNDHIDSIKKELSDLLYRINDLIEEGYDISKPSKSRNINVKIINVSNNDLPELTDEGCSGYDIKAYINPLHTQKFIGNGFHYSVSTSPNRIEIDPNNGRVLVPTGLYVEIPEGYEIQVRPRSGMALKFGITVLNSPGTIDASYRGEIGVILINTSNTSYVVESGDKIAQLVVAKVQHCNFIKSKTLNTTDRGEKGFGSSGK